VSSRTEHIIFSSWFREDTNLGEEKPQNWQALIKDHLIDEALHKKKKKKKR
jgi:hypothetical protein